jgi:hypothetical protein
MKTLFIFLLSFIATITGEATYAETCQLPATQVLDDSPGQFLVKWDFPTAGILSEKSLTDSKLIKAYQDAASAVLDVNPYHLLERRASQLQNSGDRHNLEVVITRKAGVIHKITCIESLLEDFQLQRGSNTNEFFAFYLRRQGSARVYFLTNDVVGVSGLDSLLAFLNLDKKNGWSITGNLHNHAFFLNKLENNPQGVLAPSTADVSAFQAEAKDLDLTAANITNGIHTIRIKSSDFSQFKGAQ